MSRTAVPGLAKLTPLTFSIAWATMRCSGVATFGTGDAQEPRVGGESVLFISIRQRTCGEHQRSICANQKKRGCHFAAVPHAIRRVMDGLGEQVIERFQLSWRLQPQDFGAPAAKDQAARLHF